MKSEQFNMWTMKMMMFMIEQDGNVEIPYRSENNTDIRNAQKHTHNVTISEYFQ